MKKPKRQSKQLQKQTPENEAAEQEGYRRRMNTRFLFWTVCSDAHCKRAKRCEGDGEACFQRWWPHVPEDFKQEFRLAVQGLHRGLTPEEAMREAQRKIAESKEIDARWERQDEERKAPAIAREPTPPVTAPASGPRVRSL
jgi:hypothetical protein